MRRKPMVRAGEMLLAFWMMTLLFAPWALAKPTTPEQAQAVVLNWLALNSQRMGVSLSSKIKKVQTFNYEGSPAYYVVNLDPRGLVLVPADDLVEPIIAFLSDGAYDPSPSNPLGALVSRDLPGRVVQARQKESRALASKEPLAKDSPWAVARDKWDLLSNLAGAGKASGIAGVSDMRVEPFILSRWDQTNVGGMALYNYYTFPNAAGNINNYPCGCVATAMAQLMRYWCYPTAGVGTALYDIFVDDGPMQFRLRGGDGYGSPYDWANMPLDPPHTTLTNPQRQAIGNLTRDAGLAAHMQYKADGSGAYMFDAASAMTDTFRYSNSKWGNNGAVNIHFNNRNAMVNPNLHARYPVLLGIFKNNEPVGHAVVCDGYGYDTQTLYHHLNLGWSSSYDAWYALPLVYVDSVNYNALNDIVYNVYVSGSGEIIAGRVTDINGNPMAGATVTATCSSGSYSSISDSRGCYALVKVPSSTSFTVSASKTGYIFTQQNVVTGTSVDGSSLTGNLWGVDFQATNGSSMPAIRSLLNGY